MGTRADVRTLIRNYLHKWPETDTVQSSITSTATTVTIADGARAPAGSLLEIEDEILFVRSQLGNVLTIRRGDRGSTAAAHNSPAAVLIYGQYDPTNRDLNRHLDDALDWLFPTCMNEVWDSSTTTVDNLLYYVIPASVEFVDELYITDGQTPENKKHLRYWTRIGSRVYVPGALVAKRTLIFRGWGRFVKPTSDASILDIGVDLEQSVAMYVTSMVIKTWEALRTRFTGQSALIEARSGNIPELIGSSRDWERRAGELRNKNGTVRPTMLRKLNRHL